MAASSADLDLLVGIVEAAAASEYTLAKSTKEGDRKGGGEWVQCVFIGVHAVMWYT